MQEITPALREWLAAQRQLGIANAMLLQSMVQSGWDEETARSVLDMPEAVAQVVATPLAPQSEARAADVTKPYLRDVWQGCTDIELPDRKVKVVLRCGAPELVLFGDFLSPEECEGLIQDARARLKRSETVASDTGDSEVNSARTSQGMFFSRGETELCAKIEQRIAALLSWPIERGEGLQVLRYGAGAEYKPHYDYFDPRSAGSAAVLARGGQRVGTLVMYLNTPERGGATTFPDVALEVQPVAGSAVYFAYRQASPNSLTLHGGAAVEAGEKWVATKWLREGFFR